MPELPDDFRCPNCRGVKYTRLVVTRPNGTQYVTPFLHCATCTIVFLDAMAFTHGHQDRPLTVERQSKVTPFHAWAEINSRKKPPTK
jgi:hypothetical protein